MVRAIEVIGEAASRVSDETRAANPAIPWSAIVGMRNRLVHGYFDIDTEIVWKTATEELADSCPGCGRSSETPERLSMAITNHERPCLRVLWPSTNVISTSSADPLD